jgi:hypothetical protein
MLLSLLFIFVVVVAHTGGLSNLLTQEERRTMTTAQKSSWRAKHADLTTQRKDFHGAVTYMFDGVFSWQMYGSAEALDEYGNTYTEYLMRCQWGTHFDNLQPWIVAHRFREFDLLDQMFKKQFPHMDRNMPRLPKKEIFRSMDNNVVAKRRADLEEYMSKIVESMPTLLRSDAMNNFLRIRERISAIKNLLRLQDSVALGVARETTTATTTTTTTPVLDTAVVLGATGTAGNPLATTTATTVSPSASSQIERPVTFNSSEHVGSGHDDQDEDVVLVSR